jgi:hypothetical protein
MFAAAERRLRNQQPAEEPAGPQDEPINLIEHNLHELDALIGSLALRETKVNQADCLRETKVDQADCLRVFGQFFEAPQLNLEPTRPAQFPPVQLNLEPARPAQFPPVQAEHFFPTKKKQDSILWYVEKATPQRLEKEILEFIKHEMEIVHDRKCVHGHWQAGVACYGEKFGYGSESYAAKQMPDVLNEAMSLATQYTGKNFDTALIKVYTAKINETGQYAGKLGIDSLGQHQDMKEKGKPAINLNVACFTFAEDPSQLRTVEWLAPKGSKVLKQFTPTSGSMWFMGGTTNTSYSHRVREAENPKPDGFRVSITFRQSPSIRGE